MNHFSAPQPTTGHRIFLVCSGLGYIKRGYESFVQECFEVLSPVPSLNMTLFKGGGKPSDREVVLWNLPRNGWIAILLSKALGKSAYYIEQFSFFLSLIVFLITDQPDVIYVCDINLANFIRLWRNWTKQRYKILFHNGGPIQPVYNLRWDHVQQVAPSHLTSALKIGLPPEKQSLLPNASYISSHLQLLSVNEQTALRCQLNLPHDRPLILSVGAISKRRKRMDYVIREVAMLAEPRPFLLLMGQLETDSAEIAELGDRLLGPEHFQIRTVAKTEVSNYYQIADLFVLASCDEGFGLVYVEAMSYGLPCLAHDYETARFVVGEMGYFADFCLAGSLANLITKVLVEEVLVDVVNPAKRSLRHQSVYERFSWDKLQLKYVQLLQLCASS